jgi:tRNA-dihydrouridine synthase B
MAGVTDRPFRSLCRRLGAGLAVSEMVTADASLYGSRKTVRRLDHAGEQGPISVQIVGTDPQGLAEAARMNVAHGAQIIDINMGCPAKKVCKKAAGSALLQDEKLVASILHAVVTAVDVPVTLKFRTGWDREHRNAVQIGKIAQDAGVLSLAIHGRSRADRYKGDAEYETIARVKEEVEIPVIANGDITTVKKSLEVLRLTNADGLMIGRGAQGRPWIFRELNAAFDPTAESTQLEKNELRDIMLGHLNELHRFYGETTGVRVARKHLTWYCENLENAEAYRHRVVRVDSASEQLRLTKLYFSGMDQRGTEKEQEDQPELQQEATLQAH